MSDCKHKKTMTLSMGSLWGPFEVFCRGCGVCTSNPDVEPRLDEIKRYIERDREMQEAVERFEVKMDAMTPEERAAYAKATQAALHERMKDLADQLRPFRPIQPRWRRW